MEEKKKCKEGSDFFKWHCWCFEIEEKYVLVLWIVINIQVVYMLDKMMVGFVVEFLYASLL